MPRMQPGDIITSTNSLQRAMSFVAQSQGPQAASEGCTWYGNACCKLMSSGVWRCSYPGGACTPGLETCPAWLTQEIKRQSEFAGGGFSQRPNTGGSSPYSGAGFRSLKRAQHRMQQQAMMRKQPWGFSTVYPVGSSKF